MMAVNSGLEYMQLGYISMSPAGFSAVNRL
jgi:hypothetical protein